MKKLLLLFMLGVVIISGYQLTEGVTSSAFIPDNEYPESSVEEKI